MIKSNKTDQIVIHYRRGFWSVYLKRDHARERVCLVDPLADAKKHKSVFCVSVSVSGFKHPLSLSLSLSLFRFDSFTVCRPWIFVVWGSIWVRVVLVFEPGYQNARLYSRIFPNMHTLSFCNITVVNLLWCNVRDKKILCEYSKLLFVFIYIYYKTEAFGFSWLHNMMSH